MSQRTFSIIKPDAVKKGYTGAILAEIEKAGFKIVSIKKISISRPQAEGFYHVHSARPFFGELTEFMSSGPIVPMVLEKDNAIADLRKLMGATNPAQAEEGTIRKKFAASIGENAIHGSDAEDTAAFEIGYFFAVARTEVKIFVTRSLKQKTPRIPAAFCFCTSFTETASNRSTRPSPCTRRRSGADDRPNRTPAETPADAPGRGSPYRNRSLHQRHRWCG